MGILEAIEQHMREQQELIKQLHTEVVSLKKNLPAGPTRKGWLNMAEACAYINRRPKKMRSLMNSNVIPFSQKDGDYFFKESDLEAYMQQHYTGIFKQA